MPPLGFEPRTAGFGGLCAVQLRHEGSDLKRRIEGSTIPVMLIQSCAGCGDPTTNPRFCSRSCATRYNNALVPKRPRKYRRCKVPFCTASCLRGRVYCPNHRDGGVNHDELRWLNGDNSASLKSNGEPKSFVKRHLRNTRGDRCERCHFDEKAPDGRSIIQMNHIDGNSTNNVLTNLELLCPNCHAMTDNYGSLNRGNGRAYRRRNRDPEGSRTLTT